MRTILFVSVSIWLPLFVACSKAFDASGQIPQGSGVMIVEWVEMRDRNGWKNILFLDEMNFEEAAELFEVNFVPDMQLPTIMSAQSQSCSYLMLIHYCPPLSLIVSRLCSESSERKQSEMFRNILFRWIRLSQRCQEQ